MYRFIAPLLAAQLFWLGMMPVVALGNGAEHPYQAQRVIDVPEGRYEVMEYYVPGRARYDYVDSRGHRMSLLLLDNATRTLSIDRDARVYTDGGVGPSLQCIDVRTDVRVQDERVAGYPTTQWQARFATVGHELGVGHAWFDEDDVVFKVEFRASSGRGENTVVRLQTEWLVPGEQSEDLFAVPDGFYYLDWRNVGVMLHPPEPGSLPLFVRGACQGGND